MRDAIRDIEQLKYRYLRTLDLKDWDGLGATLTTEVAASYGPALSFTGRDQLLAFLRASLGPGIITVHQCHHPEISVDGDHASGTWYLHDQVIVLEQRLLLTGAAFYEDEYRREADGTWRIARTGYVRSYEATQSLDDVPSWRLSANRWA